MTLTAKEYLEGKERMCDGTNRVNCQFLKQKQALQKFCLSNGWPYELIQSISSVMNYNKKGLKKLLKLIKNHEIESLLINRKKSVIKIWFRNNRYLKCVN